MIKYSLKGLDFSVSFVETIKRGKKMSIEAKNE